MKLLLVFLGFVLLAAVGLASQARAQEEPLSDARIEIIRSNCEAAQRSLNRTHTSDALARVNIGREYELLVTRLMTPFNSRVVLNRYDATEMVGTTSSYTDQLENFRTVYQEYERLMASAISVNCVNQPVSFYDTLTKARQKRAEVAQSTATLNKLLSDYGASLDKLAREVSSKN